MADIPEFDDERDADVSGERTRGPLDGSTSGTIGGGGRETGGPTPRPRPSDTPPARPENAAGGRMAPDPLASTAPPDPTKIERSDTSQANADGRDDDMGKGARGHE